MIALFKWRGVTVQLCSLCGEALTCQLGSCGLGLGHASAAMSQLQPAIRPQPDFTARVPHFGAHGLPALKPAWPNVEQEDLEPHVIPLPEDSVWEIDELSTSNEELQGGWSLPINLERQMGLHLQSSEREDTKHLDRLRLKYRQQMQLELEAKRSAYEEYKREFARDRMLFGAARTKSGKTLIDHWLVPVAEAIAKEQEEVMSPHRSSMSQTDRCNYAPFLTILEPKEMAVIALNVVLNMTLIPDRKDENKTGKCKAAAVCLSIGKTINDRVAVMKLHKEISRVRKVRQERKALQAGAVSSAIGDQAGTSEADTVWEEYSQNEADQVDAKLAKMSILKAKKLVTGRYLRKAIKTLEEDYHWPKEYQLKVGARLMQLIMDSAQVYNPATRHLEPAFQHSLEWLGKKQTGFISLTNPTMELIDKGMQVRSLLSGIDIAPMVVEPRKWEDLFSGGYLTVRVCVVRARHSQKALGVLKEFHRKGSMESIYQGLNALGSLPWQINRENLAVVEELWARGEYIGKMPPKKPPALPELPKQLPFRLVTQPRGALILTGGPPVAPEIDAHRHAMAAAKKAMREHKGLLVQFQHRLEIAKKCVDEDAIYYPHTLDFRGRAYPMHPHLHHLGDDVCRGLLRFSEGQALGENGLDWLYIQVANLWGQGKDKLPYQLRVRFSREQLHHILDSAMNPVKGQRWWAQGEKPFQLLATCMEVKNALASGNPSTYVSHLPVHMDGSCNGLQHYAALGRDEEGGRAVNLLPCDTPQDVYSKVSEIVANRVAHDAKLGRTEALRLDGLVDRKMVKQTVMTSVYGVTFIGARDQIRNRLKEKGWSNPQEIMKTSNYLADQTLKSIGQLFSGAKATMDWLQATAKAITTTGNVVQWVTPLGLPVLQPYTRTASYKVQTSMQSFSMLHEDTHKSSRVAKARQKQAFPPNYIHSLDSTHMMMTAIACSEAGLAFAGVHDSYWTHAGSVRVMNKILRDKFVELHSRPLLEDLRQSLQEQFPGALIPSLPKRGMLNLSQVKHAKYFFS